DRDVGQQSRRQTGPDAGSLDGSDDRLAAVDEVVDEVARLLPDTGAGGPITRHHLDHAEIAARREVASLAAQQRHRGVWVAVDLAPHLRQLAMPVAIEGIEPARIAEDDFEDARPRSGKLQGLVVAVAVGHGGLLSPVLEFAGAAGPANSSRGGKTSDYAGREPGALGALGPPWLGERRPQASTFLLIVARPGRQGRRQGGCLDRLRAWHRARPPARPRRSDGRCGRRA